jgi:tetratricopeptide (TPR) repeat protein
MWPLPRDRASLLSLLPEEERLVADTANADSPRDAQIHANALYRLGEIRFRLREMQKAEQIFDESATVFLALEHEPSKQSNRDWAAQSRVRQANAAATEGRYDDALKAIERMIEESDGFPDFAMSPEMQALALWLWLISLQEAEQFERLYEAAGTAMALVNPGATERERLIYVRATEKRARAAQALGHSDEAVAMYKRAIAGFKLQEDPRFRGRELVGAMGRLGELLIELGRTKEAASTIAHALVPLMKLELNAALRRVGLKRRAPH